MQVCTRCLYSSNHPFGIVFDNEGVCSGCKIHEEKDNLDWLAREVELSSIIDLYRNKEKVNYDCIIPVSGAKDSYFIVDTIKNKFNMNPLLVSYNTHYNTLIGIRNLQNLKTKLGCDLIQFNINPTTAREIAKYTFKKIGSIYWHNHAGHTVFPVQMAVKLRIPLVIWGMHQGIEQVGMFSHTDEVEMTRKYRKEHDLMGVEPEDMSKFDDCPQRIKNELKKYFYPTDEEIKDVQVKGIYLGNYIRWDSKAQHESMIQKYDYRTIKQYRTFNHYEDINSHFYNDIHDYIKFKKHGYSKVLDHAVQEIRYNRISRDKGLQLVSKYGNRGVEKLELFLQYMKISEDEFNSILSLFSRFDNTGIDGGKEYLDNTTLDCQGESASFIVNDVDEENPKLHSFYKGVYL